MGSDILAKIVAHKRIEIAAAKSRARNEDWERRARETPAPPDFLAALAGHDRIRVIAELKRASPSAGPIRPDFDPDPVPWRANTVSAATCYWGHLALTHGGRASEARVVREQLETLALEVGFREFYDAASGVGSGANGFSWPALALEMRAQEAETKAG